MEIIKKYSDLKPSCIFHGPCIESIKYGASSWRCNRSNCNVNHLGLDADILFKIWKRNWNIADESFQKFKVHVATNDYIFFTPFEIVCKAIESSPYTDEIKYKIEEETTFLRLEEEMKEDKNLQKLKKSEINFKHAKLIRYDYPCLACGAYPNIVGSCKC